MITTHHLAASCSVPHESLGLGSRPNCDYEDHDGNDVDDDSDDDDDYDNDDNDDDDDDDDDVGKGTVIAMLGVVSPLLLCAARTSNRIDDDDHDSDDDDDDDDVQVGSLPDLVEPGALGLNANAAVVCLILPQ